jgi:hypothetical protein
MVMAHTLTGSELALLRDIELHEGSNIESTVAGRHFEFATLKTFTLVFVANGGVFLTTQGLAALRKSEGEAL